VPSSCFIQYLEECPKETKACRSALVLLHAFALTNSSIVGTLPASLIDSSNASMLLHCKLKTNTERKKIETDLTPFKENVDDEVEGFCCSEQPAYNTQVKE